MPSRDEIFNEVSEILQDALGSDEDEVTPEAELFGDLDAESIDLLDITFQLEKKFDVKIPRAELFPGPADLGDSDTLVQDGQLTDEGMEELRKRLSHADLSKLGDNPDMAHIQGLYTVEMIVNYLDQKLN